MSSAPLGVLAGRGIYPIALCAALAAAGREIYVACLAGQSDPRRFPMAREARELPIGALARTACFFAERGARTIFFAGGVDRRGALGHARPDLAALRLLPRALLGGDDGLLGAAAAVLERRGVRVGDPRPFLGDLVAVRGRIAGPAPNAALLADFEVARRAAWRAGAEGRGQAAIAFYGRAVAVEDRRGTDALLARAPGPGAVLAKVASRGQDERFDLPSVGPSTIRIARAVGLAGIAVDAGRSLILGRPQVEALCAEHRIPLWGLAG